MPRRSSPAWGALETTILALFFLSGASALVYEVVWSRSLTYVFGGSAFAISTVLAAFMAGLALGSTIFGRLIDRRGNPLVVYGILEAAIAIWALLLPPLLGLLDTVYAGIYRGLDPGFYTLSLVRFVLCFLLLLIPTTLMGGTLPVLGKILLRDRRRLGTRAGLLYGINTLGAVVGVFAGGFILVPALGLRGATWLAVVVNLLVAALALLAAKRFAMPSRDPEPPEPAEAAADSPRQAPSDAAATPAMRRVVLWVYAASGFAALAYEVAWTKSLTMVLGTTTYAFSAMLTTFLLGLSLGAFLFGRLVDRLGRPTALLAVVQALIPLTAVATIPILGRLPQIFVDLYPSIAGNWVGVESLRFLLSGATMFVPTLLMGAMFPLCTRVYIDHRHEGRSLGTLYAANTVGAILGSFTAGFILIPFLGRQNTILAATAVNIAAVALILISLRWRNVPTGYRAVIGGAAAASVIFLVAPTPWSPLERWDPRVMSSGSYVYADSLSKESNILESMKDLDLLFYDEATEGTVSVWHGQYAISLRTSGKVEASSYGDMITQKLLSHLPSLYRKGSGGSAVMIGLASGISVGALLVHDFEHVETAELIPSMRRVAEIFGPFNGYCLDDPRHELVLNDGRNHLRLTDRTFDVIVSEPSNPWIAGVGSLFTQEFFELTRKRLAPGGVVCQWVQMYQFSEDNLRTVLATVVDAFPYVHVWNGAAGDLILVSSNDPLTIDPDRMATLMNGPFGDDIASLEILPLEQFLSYFITDREGLLRMLDGWEERVTDDNLYLEFAVPRHMFSSRTTASPFIFDRHRQRVLDTLGWSQDDADAELIERYHAARWAAYRVLHRAPLPGNTTVTRFLEAGLQGAPREFSSRRILSGMLNETAIQDLLAGEVETATAGFLQAIRIGDAGERALALNNLGTIAFRAGGMDSARAYWERSLALQPAFTTVSYNLSVLAAREGNSREQMDRIRHGLRFNPNHAPSLNNLSFVIAETGGDLVEAESLARRAVSAAPDSEIYRDTLAYILIRRGSYGKARDILTDLVKDPNAFEARLHMAMSLAGLGDHQKARTLFDEVINKAPREDLRARARTELAKLDTPSE